MDKPIEDKFNTLKNPSLFFQPKEGKNTIIILPDTESGTDDYFRHLHHDNSKGQFKCVKDVNCSFCDLIKKEKRSIRCILYRLKTQIYKMFNFVVKKLWRLVFHELF